MTAARSAWCTITGPHDPHESEIAGSVVECGGDDPTETDDRVALLAAWMQTDRPTADDHEGYLEAARSRLRILDSIARQQDEARRG